MPPGYVIHFKSSGDDMFGPISDWSENTMVGCLLKLRLRQGAAGEYMTTAMLESQNPLPCGSGYAEMEQSGLGKQSWSAFWCYDECACPENASVWRAHVYGKASISADVDLGNWAPFSSGEATVISNALVVYTGAWKGRAEINFDAAGVEGQGGSWTVGVNVGSQGVSVGASVTTPFSGDEFSANKNQPVIVEEGNVDTFECAAGKSMTVQGHTFVKVTRDNGASLSFGYATTSFGTWPNDGRLTAAHTGDPCAGGFGADGQGLQPPRDAMEQLFLIGLRGCELAEAVKPLEPTPTIHDLDFLTRLLPNDERVDFTGCIDRPFFGLPSADEMWTNGYSGTYVQTIVDPDSGEVTYEEFDPEQPDPEPNGP